MEVCSVSRRQGVDMPGSPGTPAPLKPEPRIGMSLPDTGRSGRG